MYLTHRIAFQVYASSFLFNYLVNIAIKDSYKYRTGVRHTNTALACNHDGGESQVHFHPLSSPHCFLGI
jgi:hypothetical protein